MLTSRTEGTAGGVQAMVLMEDNPAAWVKEAMTATHTTGGQLHETLEITGLTEMISRVEPSLERKRTYREKSSR